MVPLYKLNLNHKILPGCVTLGCFDGIHPCLAAATTGEKVFIHSPHKRAQSWGGRLQRSSESKEVYLLSVNQPVTALAAGRLNPNWDRDVLVIGSATNLLAYDVDKNMDLFFKDIPDGVGVISIGAIGQLKEPLAMIGGNCCIQGFDWQGNDPFWSVTGDNVCSLAFIDFDLDGENELVVGSEDYDVRIYKDDKIIGELTETEAVTALTPIKGNNFGYGLSNGTVGVYEKLQRWWRIKSKNKVVSIFSYDIDGDGVDELITGWSNGKIDGRNNRTGEVVFKDNLPHAVAGLTAGDYRLTGSKDLICCSVEGEVYGYQASAPKESFITTHLAQDTVRELFSRKHLLLMELANYKDNDKYSGVKINQEATPLQEHVGVIPAKTKLQTTLAINMGDENTKPHVEIVLCTNNETIIRATLVFGEGIFNGESHVIHPKETDLSSKVVVALHPLHNVPVDLHIKTLVGYRGSPHYHLFELTRQMPRFAMFTLCSMPVMKPAGYSTFWINERIQRIILWVNQNFLVESEMSFVNELSLAFQSLRTGDVFALTMTPSGQVTLACEDMGLVGELTQSLAVFLNLEELQSQADFPTEQDKLVQLMQTVHDLQDVRIRLGTDMAQAAGTIRTNVVHAEDAYLVQDYAAMKKWCVELLACNQDVLKDYKIRHQNYIELISSLKQVNQFIQKASKLRVGKAQAKIVSLSRQCIKNNNVNSLLRVFKIGEL